MYWRIHGFFFWCNEQVNIQCHSTKARGSLVWPLVYSKNKLLVYESLFAWNTELEMASFITNIEKQSITCKLFQLNCANLVKYVPCDELWGRYFLNLYFTWMINSLYLKKRLFVKNMRLQKRLHPFVDCLEGFCKSFDSVLHKKSYFFWYTGLANISFKYSKNGILLPKLFWPTVRKRYSSDREFFLKFRAEGPEFAKCLKSLEQFFLTVSRSEQFW